MAAVGWYTTLSCEKDGPGSRFLTMVRWRSQLVGRENFFWGGEAILRKGTGPPGPKALLRSEIAISPRERRTVFAKNQHEDRHPATSCRERC